jgi:hypothetical protein
VRLREELQHRHEALSCQLLALREEKRRIQSEIANMVEAIASGKGSPSVMAAITDREEKIREITDRLIEPGPESFQASLSTKAQYENSGNRMRSSRSCGSPRLLRPVTWCRTHAAPLETQPPCHIPCI